MRRDLAFLASPILIAATNVTGMYGFGDGHWSWVVRPLSVSIAGALIITLISLAVLRRTRLAAGVASIIVLVLAGSLVTSLALGVLGLWLLTAHWQRIHGRPAPRLSSDTVARLPSFAFTVSLLWLAVAGIVTLDDFGPPPARAAADQGRPNMYVLLLDGYPRADTLAETLDYDNGTFIRGLSELGFEVATDSESEFQSTELSLLSMFSSEPVTGDQASSTETMRTRIADASLPDQLRDAGYRLVYVPTPVLHTNLHNWDETWNGGQLSELEIILLQSSAFGPALGDWISDQLRERQQEALTALSRQSQRAGQHVTFVHLMTPHPPFLNDADGRELRPQLCWYMRTCRIFDIRPVDLGIDWETYTGLFAGQLEHTNERVLGAVRSVVTRDPDAFVVVLSDHGGRFSYAEPEEWNRSFFAARIPSSPILFRDHPGPDLLFARLLAATDE